MSSNRVILLEPLRGDADIDALHDRGEVVTMFGRLKDDLPSVFDTDRFADAITTWCRSNNFNPNSDTFVVSGRMTKIALALATITQEFGNPGQTIRVLIYDGATSEYKERLI